MRQVVVTVYETVDVADLTVNEAAALESTGVVAVRPTRTSGSWTVTAGAHVGVVTVGELELRIRPRIKVARLIFLLGYATDRQVWRDDPVGLDDQVDLWPAMAQVFARSADRATQRGLLQGYRTEETMAGVLRGRIIEAEQLRRQAGIPTPLHVRYDEYDVDIAENRILLAAIIRLLRVKRLPAESVRRLRHLSGQFADVTPLNPGQRLPSTPKSRLNSNYQPAIALARMVLGSRSIDVLDKGVKATGFLVNMNTVFEDFVAVALSESLARFGGHATSQDRGHTLDHGARVRFRPDLVYYQRPPIPAAVVDAKYKAEAPAGYPYADIYQMLAYCVGLNLPTGHLVYAEGGRPARRIRVRHVGTEIVQHALDLSAPVSDLLAQIDRVAAELAAP